MIHNDIPSGQVHTIVQWAVADAAALAALTPVAADLGKIAYQIDTKMLYALVGTGPAVWKLMTATSLAGTSVTLSDVGNYFTTDNAEAALQQIGALYNKVDRQFYASDMTTAITLGTGKIGFAMPWPATLQAAHGFLATPQVGGSIFTVDVNKNGTTVLSTKITIDNTETGSNTAATPPVISVPSFAQYDWVSVDVDQVGDGTAKGLSILLSFLRTG